MDICVYNLKMNDILAPFDKQLLPIYRKGNIASLNEVFAEKGAISTLNVDCPKLEFAIQLEMEKEDSHETDFNNIQLLYEGLKDLPPSIAAKPEFWAWYAHAFQSEYVIYRSETTRGEYDERSVLRDFFCRSKTEQPRRMLIVNLLARLWWSGRLLYDKDDANPYHVLELVTKSAYNSKMLLLASSTAPNNHEIMMGLMDAVETYKNENELDDISRAHFLPCTKYLNSIGAVKMIDTLGRAEIRRICLNRIKEVLG